MQVFVITHVEYGWDNILAVFKNRDDARQWLNWYCEYYGTPEDCLIIHSQNLRCEFKEEI